MKIRLSTSHLHTNSNSKSRNLIVPFVTAGKALLSYSKRRLSITGAIKSKYSKEILLSNSHYFIDEDEMDLEFAQSPRSNNNYYRNMAKSHVNDNNTDDQCLLQARSYRSKCNYRHTIGKLSESRRRKSSFDSQFGFRDEGLKNAKSSPNGSQRLLPCSNTMLIFIAVITFLITILYNCFNFDSPIKIVSAVLRNATEVAGNFNVLPVINLLPHKCRYPRLNPNDPEIMALFKNTKVHRYNETFCSQEINAQNIIFKADHQYLYRNGEFVIHEKSNPDKNYKEPTCCYKAFHRVDEKENWISNKCIPIQLSNNQTKFKLDEEFISLECKMPVFQKDYRDMFAFVPDKPEVESRVNQISSKLTSNGQKRDDKISVIVFGMDAVSHLHFKRQMPQSRSYLLKVLKAVPLNGYTKVAENTLPNVIPLLSGMTLEEFKADCISPQERGQQFTPNNPFFFASENNNDIHLDNCPLIWKWFSSQGYRTSYAEDQNSIGIFQMYWSKAFKVQPTDYYLKTLTKQMEELFESFSGQCLGSRLSFKVLLDHMLNVADAFKERLYFQFSWSTRLSHDKMEHLHWGDQDLYNTLKSLHDHHHLNKSVLIFLSDHGSRLDKIRKLYQGQVEDRMPLAYIVVPPWFKVKYPEAVKNLRENSQKLTSAFDLHKTLLDLTHLNNLNDGNIKWKDGKLSETNNGQNRGSGYHFFENINRVITRRSKSLFEKLDENRTCMEAGVPLHWCLCQIKEPIATDSPVVKQAAKFALAEMNKYIQSKEQQTGNNNNCEKLRLSKITDAIKWKDEKFIAKSTDYYDIDSNQSSINTTLTNNDKSFKLADALILQISFITDPGEGAFEATVVQLPAPRRRKTKTDWILTERVVRTNSYSEQSYCVDDYELKEYCYCNTNMEYFI